MNYLWTLVWKHCQYSTLEFFVLDVISSNFSDNINLPFSCWSGSGALGHGSRTAPQTTPCQAHSAAWRSSEITVGRRNLQGLRTKQNWKTPSTLFKLDSGYQTDLPTFPQKARWLETLPMPGRALKLQRKVLRNGCSQNYRGCYYYVVLYPKFLMKEWIHDKLLATFRLNCKEICEIWSLKKHPNCAADLKKSSCFDFSFDIEHLFVIGFG